MFYEHVFTSLARHGVKYAVAGGLAVNLHGIPRMTADIDLVVSLDSDNLQAFLHAMKELGFRPRLPVPAEDILEETKRDDWIARRNLHAFTFWNEQRPYEEVDLLLSASRDAGIVQRASMVRVGDLTICVASIGDIIEMKRGAGRVQDRADIEALQELEKVEDE